MEDGRFGKMWGEKRRENERMQRMVEGVSDVWCGVCVCAYLGASRVERVPRGLVRWMARLPLRLYDSVN